MKLFTLGVLAMFGFGTMELVILAGCCAVPLLIGAAVAVVLLLAKNKQK